MSAQDSAEARGIALSWNDSACFVDMLNFVCIVVSLIVTFLVGYMDGNGVFHGR